MLRLRLFVLLCAFAAHPAHGQNDGEMANALEKVLSQYAKSAGVLARCFEGPGEAGIQREAERIAAWRYPGAWSSVSGERTQYRDLLVSKARLDFITSRLGGACPGGLLIGPYKTMVSVASNSIRQYTEE